MAITLGTNIPSLVARMNLNNNSTDLSTTLERLSTGNKINKASDDAAGLVVSENMKAIIGSSTQAMKNIQNANAFLAIAEDGMATISDHFQRISDLLTNMATDSNDKDSRTAAAREIKQRIEEINRIAESTNFNGKTMLDGSVESLIIQIGPDETDASILDISAALTDCHVNKLAQDLPNNLDPDQEGEFDPDNQNCRDYLKVIQDAISKIATQRGLLGAYENRMDSSYDALSAKIESLETAKSLYTDTDIAEEAASLVQRQIMQQIDVSVLSNANSLQQMALSLLGG